jgi:hypothetical protein
MLNVLVATVGVALDVAPARLSGTGGDILKLGILGTVKLRIASALTTDVLGNCDTKYGDLVGESNGGSTRGIGRSTRSRLVSSMSTLNGMDFLCQRKTLLPCSGAQALNRNVAWFKRQNLRPQMTTHEIDLVIIN